MEDNRYDAYILVISNDEYKEKVKENKINNYINKLKDIKNKISKLPEEQEEEVFGLLDRLFNIVK